MMKAIHITAFFLVVFSGYAIGQGGKAEPLRIELSNGKNSATIKENLKNGQQAEYVFAATAGQTVKVSIVAAPRGRHFDLRIAGSSFELETDDDDHSSIEFTAPESGDYMIYVEKREHTRYVNAAFTMTVKVD